MKRLVVFAIAGALCWFVSLGSGPNVAAQPDKPPPEQQEGVESQLRGPVHEAYAAPQSLNPGPAPIVPKKPPEPVAEMPPDQKPEGSHVAWIGGYWAWDDDSAEYMWISGFWRDIPPGKQWVPGYWSDQDGGSQWTSGVWADEQQTEVNYLPPPPPSIENGPSTAAPDPDQFYSPGSWVYVERNYRWRPGFWVKHRPNWAYVPAYYVWTPAGCIFTDGYWDYEITRRGLLFCPIRFTANVWTRANWRLENRFIIYPEMIVNSLFVRIDYHRYCFGDYFGASYVGHGFVPWVDYRLHKNIPEPMFRQFAVARRVDVNWQRDFRKLYDDRRLGLALRPPRTIVEQQRFQRELALNKSIRVGDKTFAFKDVKVAESRFLMTNSLARVDKKVVVLTKLTPAAHVEVIKTIEHHTAVTLERKTTAIKIQQMGPIRPADPIRTLKLPVIPKHLETPKTIVRPVAPVIPVHVEKVVPKFELPKAIHANPKPLKHGSLTRPSELRTAQAEWIGVPETPRVRWVSRLL